MPQFYSLFGVRRCPPAFGCKMACVRSTPLATAANVQGPAEQFQKKGARNSFMLALGVLGVMLMMVRSVNHNDSDYKKIRKTSIAVTKVLTDFRFCDCI